jgi:pSer/pThr/pTyr-binding forkhead associated (FHA) protein
MSGPILLILRILMALSLYAFLVGVLLILWQDMKRQSNLFSIRKIQPIKLVNLTEENDQSYQFSTPEVSLGRDSASDCQLNDDTVSAKHAHLSYHHSNWWITDLDSKNGTYLNQDEVKEPHVLTSGDKLQCGQVVLLVSISDLIQ